MYFNLDKLFDGFNLTKKQKILQKHIQNSTTSHRFI